MEKLFPTELERETLPSLLKFARYLKLATSRRKKATLVDLIQAYLSANDKTVTEYSNISSKN